MPGPPPFEASVGNARVPRERRQDTHGTASSSSGLVRLTPGPGASLPQDLAEDPICGPHARLQLYRLCGHVFNGQDHDYARSRQLASC